MSIVAKARKKSVKILWSPNEIARLLGFGPNGGNHVRNWIKAGKLPYEHFLDYKEFRVHRNILRRFLEANKHYEALKVLDAEEGLERDYPDQFEEPPPADLVPPKLPPKAPPWKRR